MTDLFSIAAQDIEPADDLDRAIEKLISYTKTLSSSEEKRLNIIREGRDIDEWIAAARNFHKFALTNSLDTQWNSVTEAVKASAVGELWSPKWEAALDGAVALLLKPWLGVSIYEPDFKKMTEVYTNSSIEKLFKR